MFKIKKNIKRIFNIKFIICLVRGNLIRLFKINIKQYGFKYYLGSNSQIIANKNGEILLKDKIWISSNVKIQADSGIIEIGNNTFINDFTRIISMKKICIGNNCIIGPNVSIYDHDHRYAEKDKFICKQGYNISDIIIEDDVWIGSNVFIGRGVKIGKHSVIAANSVIVKDVMQYTVVGGNPGKIIKYI